jgi:hypothetical protein
MQGFANSGRFKSEPGRGSAPGTPAICDPGISSCLHVVRYRYRISRTFNHISRRLDPSSVGIKPEICLPYIPVNVADPGCFIPDPNIFPSRYLFSCFWMVSGTCLNTVVKKTVHPGSWSRIRQKLIPDQEPKLACVVHFVFFEPRVKSRQLIIHPNMGQLTCRSRWSIPVYSDWRVLKCRYLPSIIVLNVTVKCPNFVSVP